MANVYGRNNTGTTRGAAPAAVTTNKATGPAAGTLFTTGLFAPLSEKSKAIGTVQIKETITIPAGSYLNLYQVDQPKNDKSPIFRMQVREGVLKKQA